MTKAFLISANTASGALAILAGIAYFMHGCKDGTVVEEKIFITENHRVFRDTKFRKFQRFRFSPNLFFRTIFFFIDRNDHLHFVLDHRQLP